MTWRWRTGTVPAGWPSAGTSVAAVAAGGRVHMFPARPDGRAVSHLTFGPDPAGVRQPDLPSASVSGAAAGRDGPLVA